MNDKEKENTYLTKVENTKTGEITYVDMSNFEEFDKVMGNKDLRIIFD